MSLKFVLGDFQLRPPLGTLGRVEEEDRKLESVAPYKPILITFDWKKPEPGAIRRFLVRARQAFVGR
jgi:hypothetical protein